MEYWFWIVICYSFFGYLLERMFAKVTVSPRQVRKCFLLLPLCPVYGLAMGLHLALLPPEAGFAELAVRGAVVCTAAEYLVHLLYDRLLGVRFWDYTGAPGNLAGRICLPFSAAWGLLSALAVRWVQPELARLIALLPPGLTYAVLLILTADILLSARLLRRWGDTELLGWRTLTARLRPAG